MLLNAYNFFIFNVLCSYFKMYALYHSIVQLSHFIPLSFLLQMITREMYEDALRDLQDDDFLSCAGKSTIRVLG